jgi:multidrug efflux pump
MNISAPFIERPIATTLLTIAIALAGGVGYVLLPVSPLPQVEFPTIQVSAGLPGASPETMASSVATPLERQFGRIAGLTEMTSASQLGSTQVVLQFDLSRDIDGAARDVQAAINAARSQLPANLPGNPSYRKVNPADAPIMMLALTSDLVSRARLYDLASSILQQRIAQVDGVGQVFVGGGALPAVRVEVNPTALNARGLGLEDLRAFLRSANVNSPKGQLGSGARSWSLASTDQLYNASAYQPLVIAYNNGGAVRLQDVADVVDSVEDVRTGGYANGKPAVLIIVSREPGANIIAAVDGIRALLPTLQASVPPTTTLSVLSDRTTTIRASVHDVQITMLISIALVVLVVFVFLQNVRYTIIPAVVVPVSLIGTLAVMYLCGYSLDNLSLMALTIATGFVVDDAIVVIENISRHLERGVPPLQASLLGAKEIGFTVISISLSLVAVFIPILLMSGIVGRLFREFAVTLSIAIIVSLAVSLTTTPMMCAFLLGPRRRADGSAARERRDLFDGIREWYGRSLTVVLRHQGATLAVTLATMLATGYLYIRIPKGFFPQQDTGAITGSIQADQDTSFQAMQQRVARFGDIVMRDPGVATVLAYVGGGGIQNSARMFVNLKPRGERDADATAIINRLRRHLTDVPGAVLYLQAAQDLRIGGRSSSAQYQYTLQSDDVAALDDWAPRLYDRLRQLPGLTDVNSDLLTRGLQASLSIDRPTASRLGITPQAIDDTLYDAFGQRQVSTMYTALNQYHVVMVAAPSFWQSPQGLGAIYLPTSTGGQVPLAAFARYAPSTAPLAVNHQTQFPSVTISFNLAAGVALGDAVTAIGATEQSMGVPASIRGSFQGTAQAYQQSLASQPWLVAAALAAVYVVLGVLYESYIHPITILSTLPSAGVGALLALMLCRTELTIIALVGIILLIGIVKKNAILMIDFALEAERVEGKPPEEAIFQACVLRFRPILMTTMAALFGALPLAVGFGTGAELRRPLGIAIVGGLIVSQVLTLYTTPVVYLYLDRLRAQGSRLRAQGSELRQNL